MTVAGQLGDDAKRYQERAIAKAIEESRPLQIMVSVILDDFASLIAYLESLASRAIK